MSVPPDHLKNIFYRLLKGEATAAEKEQVAAYLADKKHTIDWNELLPYEDWENAATEPLVTRIREKVLDHVLQQQNDALQQQNDTGAVIFPLPGQQKKGLRRWMLCAAAVFLVCAGAAWYFTGISTGKKSRWLFIAAANGEKKKILLPDSSLVYLNAGSRLQFPERFGEHDREVILSGEAFFEVRPDAENPFIVQSGTIRTKVLGTSFNIKAYAEDADIAIAVKTGRIQVTDAAADTGARFIIVTPGQQTLYTGAAKTFHVQTIDTATIAGWKENHFVFTDCSLQEIISTIEKTYNVHITASPAGISLCRYSVVFNHLTLRESLNKLSLLGGLRISRQDSLIILKGKPCRQ